MIMGLIIESDAETNGDGGDCKRMLDYLVTLQHAYGSLEKLVR
jgi:hypothetical protein